MNELLTLTDTIYGEARGEYLYLNGGLQSLIAVANVIMNRLSEPQKYGRSIQNICLKPKQFSCWNEGDPNLILLKNKERILSEEWKIAHFVAQKVSAGLWPDLTKKSTHYHALSAQLPRWAQGVKPTIQIGHHIFYKL